MPNTFSVNARPISILMSAVGVWLLVVRLIFFLDGLFRSWIVSKAIQTNEEIPLFPSPLGMASLWVAPALAAIVTAVALWTIFENINRGIASLTSLFLATVTWGLFGFTPRIGPLVTSLAVGILSQTTLLTLNRVFGRPKIQDAEAVGGVP